jgi:hypothetical protein
MKAPNRGGADLHTVIMQEARRPDAMKPCLTDSSVRRPDRLFWLITLCDQLLG